MKGRFNNKKQLSLHWKNTKKTSEICVDGVKTLTFCISVIVLYRAVDVLRSASSSNQMRLLIARDEEAR